MRNLSTNELKAVSGGANPHLTTISVTTNPGGVVNKSSLTNPNAITTTITFKTTGKPVR
jgi:bacteriocin-like protein